MCVVSPCAGVVRGCARKPGVTTAPPLLALWPSQVLLGAFGTEAEAAHAYDLVVLTVEGPRAAVTNVSSRPHLSTPVLHDCSMLELSVLAPKHAAGPDTLPHFLVPLCGLQYDASECGGAGLGQLLAAGMHAVLRCISNYQQTMAR